MYTFGKEHTTVNDRRHKVLIVDDERTIANTLDLIFSASGYETRAAYSAEQALEIITGWLPDLAIIDVVLPLMSGIDLAILLTAQCPACRILLFSGQSLTADLLVEATTKGYTFDILAKPVHPTVLLERALNLLVANQSKQAQELGASEVLRLPEADPLSET
jgi:DNA-binding response OmpR family regulator